MSCEGQPGPVAVSGFVLQSTGGLVTSKMMHDSRQHAGSKEDHPKAMADPEKMVADFKILLRDLRIHEDSPDASDIIIRMETGEITLSNGFSEAMRNLGGAVIDNEKAHGRLQCETCAQFISPDDPSHACRPALVNPLIERRGNERVDIHRPSSPDFDPQAYTCHGVYASSARYAGYTTPRIRQQVVSNLISNGYRIGHGSSGQCGHCGHAILYGALMVREDVKEFIFVGEDCLDNRFDLDKDEFQQLRKTASLNRFREKISERKERFLEEHPDLVGLDQHDHHVLKDMNWRLEQNGELSEAQVNYARTIIKKEQEKKERLARQEAEKQALLAAGVKPPSGKVEGITGEVLHVKYEENNFSYHTQYTTKMLVQHPDGWKVWVTVPAKGIGDDPQFADADIREALVGKKVQFTATLTPSEKNPLVAFGKNPSKAKVIDS